MSNAVRSRHFNLAHGFINVVSATEKKRQEQKERVSERVRESQSKIERERGRECATCDVYDRKTERERYRKSRKERKEIRPRHTAIVLSPFLSPSSLPLPNHHNNNNEKKLSKRWTMSSRSLSPRSFVFSFKVLAHQSSMKNTRFELPSATIVHLSFFCSLSCCDYCCYHRRRQVSTFKKHRALCTLLLLLLSLLL